MLTKDNTLEIKGMAIICMIFYHLFGFPERIGQSGITWMGHHFTKAFLICVPIFLFMSGYGLQCLTIKGKMTGRNLITRIGKLYRSYWTVCIPFAAGGIACGFYPPQFIDIKNIILTISGFAPVFNGEWWFFYNYLELLVIFGILQISIHRVLTIKECTLSFLILLIVSRLICSNFNLSDSIIWQRHLKMALMNANIFFLGSFFAKFNIFGRLLALNCSSNFIFTSICLILPIITRMYMPFTGIMELFTVPIFIIGIIGISNYGLSPLFQLLGRHSANMWLIHSGFIYYYLSDITFLTHNPAIMFLTVTCCSLGCSICIETIKGLSRDRFSMLSLKE